MALFFDTFPEEVVSNFPPLNSGWVLISWCPGEFGGSATTGLSGWMRVQLPPGSLGMLSLGGARQGVRNLHAGEA